MQRNKFNIPVYNYDEDISLVNNYIMHWYDIIRTREISNKRFGIQIFKYNENK